MNALVAAGIVFGTTKTYGMFNNIEVPMAVYGQGAAIMGVSKILADNGTKDPVIRALASGGLYAGISFSIFNDNNWALNLALGATSSYIADIVLQTKFQDEE